MTRIVIFYFDYSAWERTKVCFDHLIGECQDDQYAVRDLNLTLTRYVVHSLPCYSEELRGEVFRNENI